MASISWMEIIIVSLIPVSDARRVGLRELVEVETLPDKAGLVGANISCLVLSLGMDLEEGPAWLLYSAMVSIDDEC